MNRNQILYEHQITELISIAEETCIRHPIAFSEIKECIKFFGVLTGKGYTIDFLKWLIKSYEEFTIIETSERTEE